MQPVPGLNGARPAARLKVLQLRGKCLTEEPRDLAAGRQRELGRQQERIAECSGVRCGSARAELRQQLPGLAINGIAATAAAQVDMLERQAQLDAEGVGMLLQEGLELLIRRGYRLGSLLGEELQLLPQATADDGVVAVQAHDHCLAVPHLVTDVVVNQACQLLCRGWALPGAREADRQMLKVAGRDHDLASPCTAAVAD